MLASTISGAPGSLQAFVETATTNKENITELRHRCDTRTLDCVLH